MKVGMEGKLIESLLFIIKDLITTKDSGYNIIFENVIDELKNRNIMNAATILNTVEVLQNQEPEVLYVLCNALYKETKIEKINPHNFFTEIEIEKKLKNFKKEKRKINKITKFSNAIQVTEDQWICVMKMKEYIQICIDGKITYNPETQRGVVYKENKGIVITVPKVSKARSRKISKTISKGNYIPDTITINISKNGEEDFEIKDGSIFVYDGRTDCIDGYHRTVAMVMSYIDNPNNIYLNENITIRVTNYSSEKAMQYINQINKQEKITESRQKSLDLFEYENVITKAINENPESDLKGKIATDELTIRQGRAYVQFSLLSDAIKYNFVGENDKKNVIVENGRDARKVSKFMVDFFNEVYGIFSDDFENYTHGEKQNMKIDPFTFIGYVALASKLYNKSNWEDILENVLENFDFSFNNTEYLGKIPKNRKVTNASIEDISEYFKNLI